MSQTHCTSIYILHLYLCFIHKKRVIFFFFFFCPRPERTNAHLVIIPLLLRMGMQLVSAPLDSRSEVVRSLPIACFPYRQSFSASKLLLFFAMGQPCALCEVSIIPGLWMPGALLSPVSVGTTTNVTRHCQMPSSRESLLEEEGHRVEQGKQSPRSFCY